jgi:hypothetical protein
MYSTLLNFFKPHHPVRIFFITAFLSLAIGVWVLLGAGWSALWLFIVLSVLEVTFSFDNAVINSRVLVKMSKLWQALFLTVGILIAVFGVRFVLPIFIVMVPTGLGFGDVISLALHEPEHYAHALETAGPMISSFGGSFLAMIGLAYFMDRKKRVHWLGLLERPLARLGKIHFFHVYIMLIVAGILYFTVPGAEKVAVLLASLTGIALHVIIDVAGRLMDRKQPGSSAIPQVGMAAFVSFLYLEVLDASFSLDGVIGAFALTSSVLLIMAGLGVGALWVRSLTVYMVRTKALARYKFLEQGAHWAIIVLGSIMFAKLYGMHPPEWFTGSIGLVCVIGAVIASIYHGRKTTPVEEQHHL